MTALRLDVFGISLYFLQWKTSFHCCSKLKRGVKERKRYICIRCTLPPNFVLTLCQRVWLRLFVCLYFLDVLIFFYSFSLFLLLLSQFLFTVTWRFFFYASLTFSFTLVSSSRVLQWEVEDVRESWQVRGDKLIFMSESLLCQLWVQLDRLPSAQLTSQMGVVQVLGTPLPIQFPANMLGKDQDKAPGSLLSPNPTLAFSDIWGVDQKMEDMHCFSVTLPFKWWTYFLLLLLTDRIYLFERQNYKTKRSSIHLYCSPDGQKGQGWAHLKPRMSVSSGSLTLMAGSQMLGLCSAAFPGTFSGNWIRSRITNTARGGFSPCADTRP